MGAKRRLIGTSKVNTHTTKQTNIWTFRLIESIGPEGRCLENFEPQQIIETAKPRNVWRHANISDMLFDQMSTVHRETVFCNVTHRHTQTRLTDIATKRLNRHM